MSLPRIVCWGGMLAAALTLPSRLSAQVSAPGSLASYNYRASHYQRPSVRPGRNTYFREFYHNSAVSPYSNLMMPNRGSSVNNYYRYVLPEEQRRNRIQAQTAEMRRPVGSVVPGVGLPSTGVGSRGLGVPSSASSLGQYHNHWYGSRQSMGLH